MTEVETRLSEMRDAADQINRACLRIDQCIQTVRADLAALASAGWQNEQVVYFLAHSRFQSSQMEAWGETVRKLAADLNRAADDIESAVSRPAPATTVLVSSSGGGGGRSGYRGRIKQLAAAPLPPAYPLGAYIALTNRPLYDQLTRDQQKLTSEQIRLDALLQTRAGLNDDLIALKNRLRSYDPSIHLDKIPRVQALQTQLDQFDAQIAEARGNISHLQTEIAGFTTRLERVNPGPGADLNLIAQLETSVTPHWIKDNTEGCVNYIANRMPIPEGIALDAYQWDDRAAQLTQYGITSGAVPLPGAVIVLEREHSYADDLFGHLLYVEKVENGLVWVTDNHHATPVNLADLTSELSGPYIKYLYFPWWTTA
jgi:prefoldin subunit 5